MKIQGGKGMSEDTATFGGFSLKWYMTRGRRKHYYDTIL